MAVVRHWRTLLSFLLLLVQRTQLILRSYLAEAKSSARRSEKATEVEEEDEPRPRLSSALSNIKPAYDVVVIGSGYGGGVAASRMARAQPKQSVCVLERGSERTSAVKYPASFWKALMDLRVTGHLYWGRLVSTSMGFGRVDGLHRWVCGKGSSVFMASG